VADNVDHNIRTLDGFGTFHGMGIISTTVFPPGVFANMPRVVRRLPKPMKASDATQSKCVPILFFDNDYERGVKFVKLRPIRSLQRPLEMPDVMNLNILWHAGGMMSSNTQPRPNWSGFMHSVCQGEHAGVSSVQMLSIVDLNPSDNDCIYSTLMFVINQAKLFGITMPNITFDQPLFIKAVDIAMKANLNIVVRLGGFHTLMSFLGSIGHLMKGSGLEEILALLFGPNTVEHILSGKAYARVVGAHFLIHAVMTDVLLYYLKNPKLDEENPSPVIVCSYLTEQLAGSLCSELCSDLDMFYEQTIQDKVCATDDNFLQCDSLVSLDMLLQDLKCLLRQQSRTSRLWLLYMTYVDTVKLFLLGERTGNWLVHLHAMQDMPGLFASTGHVNYAKSAHLYLQQMGQLEETHPLLYEQFLNGFHSVRPSNRYWAGLLTTLSEFGNDCITECLYRLISSLDKQKPMRDNFM